MASQARGADAFCSNCGLPPLSLDRSPRCSPTRFPLSLSRPACLDDCVRPPSDSSTRPAQPSPPSYPSFRSRTHSLTQPQNTPPLAQPAELAAFALVSPAAQAHLSRPRTSSAPHAARPPRATARRQRQRQRWFGPRMSGPQSRGPATRGAAPSQRSALHRFATRPACCNIATGRGWLASAVQRRSGHRGTACRLALPINASDRRQQASRSCHGHQSRGRLLLRALQRPPGLFTRVSPVAAFLTRSKRF